MACPGRGCQGRLVQEYSSKDLYDQLKYYETLFDVERAQAKVNVGHLFHRWLLLRGEDRNESQSSDLHVEQRKRICCKIFAIFCPGTGLISFVTAPASTECSPHVLTTDDRGLSSSKSE